MNSRPGPPQGSRSCQHGANCPLPVAGGQGRAGSPHFLPRRLVVGRGRGRGAQPRGVWAVAVEAAAPAGPAPRQPEALRGGVLPRDRAFVLWTERSQAAVPFPCLLCCLKFSFNDLLGLV